MIDKIDLLPSGHLPPIFYSCWTTVLKAVDARYDVRGSMLSPLVKQCLENRAKVPQSQRALYERFVQKEALAYTECITALLLFGRAGRFSPSEYRYAAVESCF
ncbi:hypothetical protein B7H19_08810 [Pseudomonas putida]|nr:hypothetical protein [Pseudomonas putida]ORL69780.1 hypothetical protein B7H19_08810 [Pseudomonas putida]